MLHLGIIVIPNIWSSASSQLGRSWEHLCAAAIGLMNERPMSERARRPSAASAAAAAANVIV